MLRADVKRPARKTIIWGIVIFLAFFIALDNNGGVEPMHPLFDATTPDIVHHYGYPVEIHTVQTEDGYNLQLHRIPSKLPDAKPVFFQHGLLCSSFDWVINPPDQSLSYALADEGYDVWMGNFRGNSYSITHQTRSSDQHEFWDFSYDEMGRYDLPAMIDYVLNETNHSKLHYIGHSMGTTTYFILMHYRPEYNDKVESLFGLGPTTRVNNIQSVLHDVAFLLDFGQMVQSVTGIHAFFPDNFIKDFASYLFCKEGDITQGICGHIVNSIAGFSEQRNKTMWPVYFSGTPAGTSFQTVRHYKQAITAPKFQAFDHSPEKNLQVYGQYHPPEYDVTRTKSPAYFYYGNNDVLTRPEDVIGLANKLPNVKKVHRIEEDDYNHMDFIWGMHNQRLLNNDIINTIIDIDCGGENSTQL